MEEAHKIQMKSISRVAVHKKISKEEKEKTDIYKYLRNLRYKINNNHYFDNMKFRIEHL